MLFLAGAFPRLALAVITQKQGKCFRRSRQPIVGRQFFNSVNVSAKCHAPG
jgi:hypothetical protein